MFTFGIVVYVILALLVIMFWRRARGRSLEEIFAQSEADHHGVNDVHAAYPLGGTWKQHLQWMQDAAAKH
jgi:hypothetical protein